MNRPLLRGAIAGSLLIAVVSSGAATQSPDPSAPTLDPVPQSLCVTFRHAPGFVIGPDTLAAGLDSGEVVVLRVLPSSSCLPDEPVVEPVDGAADNSLYLDYLSRQADATNAYDEENDTMRDALGEYDYKAIARSADKMVRWADGEIEWLDEHEAAACYADDQDDWREVVVAYRGAFVDLSYGAKHETAKGLKRLNRSVERLNEANDLFTEYNDTDYLNDC